ncbi:MAG: hypothetical protein ICV77_10610 [Cyanobacteria bacterium Co-bin8]|nr:hypothetical protein [Cyanobacteria bacterium Co-bin8]
MSSQEYSFRLKWAAAIVLRNGAIGLMSGSVLGALFGCFYFTGIFWAGTPGFLTGIFWEGINAASFVRLISAGLGLVGLAAFAGTVGAGLGLGLGLVSGLLLSLLSCLFFYPLRYVQLYHAVVKLVGTLVAAVGALSFWPWYFSSKGMTPITAVTIGFVSVLVSTVAGWAGWLASQNISQWYEQQYTGLKGSNTPGKTLHSVTPSRTASQKLKAIFSSMGSEWIYVALFSLICSFGGKWLLNYVICGNQDAFSCLPSPRLYTSVAAGLKVALPTVLVAALIAALLQSRVVKRCFRAFR